MLFFTYLVSGGAVIHNQVCRAAPCAPGETFRGGRELGEDQAMGGEMTRGTLMSQLTVEVENPAASEITSGQAYGPGQSENRYPPGSTACQVLSIPISTL